MADATKGSLQGLRIALTRQAADNAVTAAELAARGATVESCPLVRVTLLDPDSVTLRRVDYDWLAATSRRALAWLDWRRDRPLPPVFGRTACVGPATAQYAKAVLGLEPLVGAKHTAAALAEAMGDLKGRTVLFPRGDLARETLSARMREAGADVDDPVVYRTLADHAGAARLVQLLARGELDAVAFASPSAVKFALDAGAELSRARCFSIGPTTADALLAAGVAVAGQAATAPELADAIAGKSP
ncbi:MAG: uroporphyrinogen-III synthase [Planctomycetes bacterium]|nr:uroporphyrinogen-III synthase [Planctomycetota bacterium]